VVVIGGGIVGTAVLYHLTKLGWSDVVLVERKQLTAGSTWHAAGGFHAMNSDPNVARLQAYGLSVYREVQAISGHDVGLHLTGGIQVAATADRWENIRYEQAKHRVLGIDSHLVTPKEIETLCPIMDTRNVIGGLFDIKFVRPKPLVTRDRRFETAERTAAETFKDFITRIGKRQVKAMLEDLTQVPSHEENSWYYQDWGDTREFTMADLGKGECAGEVVSIPTMEIAAAEREVFEAQVAFDEGSLEVAWQGALSAMLRAARALVKEQFYDVPETPEVVVAEFRTRFYDSELFSPKFANYLFAAQQNPPGALTKVQVHRFIEEAQLFIEGAYTCYDKIATLVGTTA